MMVNETVATLLVIVWMLATFASGFIFGTITARHRLKACKHFQTEAAAIPPIDLAADIRTELDAIEATRLPPGTTIMTDEEWEVEVP